MRYPWVLVAGIAGSSMILIDATAVNVALPVMQRDLAANAGGLQWIIESYTLFLASLMLVGGALGDRFGRCLVFSIGIAIFTLASIGCALAPTLEILIVARCVQGIGAALATPGSLALLSAVYSGKERDRAIGIWSGASAIATAAAPLLGGWLTQTFSWRAVFLINVPLGIVVVAVAFMNVPESRDEKMGTLDGVGSGLVTAGLAALVYGLIRLQTAGMDSFAAGAVAFGIALLATFAAY
jgi:MFS family permease